MKLLFAAGVAALAAVIFSFCVYWVTGIVPLCQCPFCSAARRARRRTN